MTSQQQAPFAYPASSDNTNIHSQNGAGGGSQVQSRQTAEEARKDRTLADFLLMLDDYEPLVCSSRIQTFFSQISIQIPNEVSDYFLQRVGFECEDHRLYATELFS